MSAQFDLKAIISAEDNASSTISKVGSSLSNLGGMVAKYGALAVGALGTAATFAIKNAADVQMLRQNFDTLLGSAEKGRTMFTDLQKMANITPFETQDLAQAASTLLAYGVSSEKIIPTIQRIGDVSLGNKNKFNMLSLAFSQVASTGRLMGQDLLQMTSQGFNPLQIISEKTGKSMTDLKKEMEKGLITFDMVDDAFKTATGEGGKFHDGMANGAKILTGVMSTLSDNVKITARSIVGLSESGDVVKGGLFDKVSSAISVMIGWLDANKEAITRLGTEFMTGFLTAVTTIVGWIVILCNWFIQTKDKIVEFFTQTQLGQTILLTFQGLIQGVVDQAKNLWQIILDNKQMFKELGIGLLVLIGGAIALFLAALTVVIWTVGKVIQAISWLRDESNKLKDALVYAFTNPVDAIKKYFNTIINGYNKVIGGLNKIAGGKIPTIPTFQSGGIMPYEGLAYLHKGERIIPSSMTTNNAMSVNIYGNINNQRGLSPEEIGQIINRQILLTQQGAA